MKCSFDKERLALLLMDSTSEAERIEIESHISTCADCRMEFKAYKKVWGLMEETPKPVAPDSLRAGFDAMLDNYVTETEAKKRTLPSLFESIADMFRLQVRPNLAFSLVLLAAGLTGGWLLRSPSQQTTASSNKKIDSLSSQVYEMKQLMMLSLLQNPSASQRIQAVSYTEEIGSANKKVIEALFTTLNEDPNVNVRLMTLEALAKLAKEPMVREGLVQSIIQQDSPLLQSAIADIMVKLQEKKSIHSLKQLLDKKDLNEMVRLKIEQSIHKLI